MLYQTDLAYLNYYISRLNNLKILKFVTNFEYI